MRIWFSFFLMAVLPLQALAQRFELGRLQKDAVRYPAPPALQVHLANEERKVLEQCIHEGQWGLKRAEDFFAAFKVALGQRNEVTYLVFSTTFCPSYFGNGPAPYWVVQEAGGQFRTLHFSTTEAIRICKSTSSGFRDIEQISRGPEPEGDRVSTVQYNGSRYGPQPLGRCSR